jgi:hypothetical protein
LNPSSTATSAIPVEPPMDAVQAVPHGLLARRRLEQRSECLHSGAQRVEVTLAGLDAGGRARWRRRCLDFVEIDVRRARAVSGVVATTMPSAACARRPASSVRPREAVSR